MDEKSAAILEDIRANHSTRDQGEIAQLVQLNIDSLTAADLIQQTSTAIENAYKSMKALELALEQMHQTAAVITAIREQPEDVN